MRYNHVGLEDVVRLTRHVENCSTVSEFEDEAFPKIVHTLGGESSVVFLKRPDLPDKITLGAGYNFTPQALQHYISGYRALDPVQAKLERGLLSSSTARASTEDSSPAGEFLNSRYFHEFLQPSGIYRYMCSAQQFPEKFVVQFGIHRTRLTPSFTDEDYVVSQALLPSIARVFERERNKSLEILLSTICESLCASLNQRGVIVLNEEGDVLYADQSASDLLQPSSGKGQEHITPNKHVFRTLINRVRHEIQRSAPRPVVVNVQIKSRIYKNGAIRLLPYPGTHLYLLTLERRHEASVHLSSHLGLSPRLTEITELLITGHTNAEIAEKLQISINTARNQISAIYDRLSVHGRVELVRLITGMPAIRGPTIAS